MSQAETIDPQEWMTGFSDNPAAWIESSLFIVDKNSKKVPFTLNPVQSSYMESISERDWILKARKMGMSSLTLARWLHACVFRKNTRAVVISHDKEATARLLERLRYMLKNSLYPIVTGKDNSSTITFPDTDSWLYIGTAGTRAFGRGDDVTHALLSEIAFYQSLDVITSVGEALVHNAVVVIETTANGAGTPAHELWLKAERGESNYQAVFFPWFSDPEYAFSQALTDVNGGAKSFTPEEKKIQATFNLTPNQILWRRWKIKEMHGDVKKFMQEFPATSEEAWLSSGRMVFDWDAIRSQEAPLLDDKGNHIPPKWQGILVDRGTKFAIEPMKEGPLKVWDTAREDDTYVMTFDSGNGVEGGDWSVADVWHTGTWKQVAQLRVRLSPEKFGDDCFALGSLYNWCSIAGENNYPGNAVLMRLRDKKYPNLWRDPLASQRISGDAGEPGFKTTEKSKGQMISDLGQSLGEKDIRIMSPETFRELKTFCVLENGSLGAREGCHDDTVISAAIGAFILKRWTMDPEQRQLSTRNHLSVRLRGIKPAYGMDHQQSGQRNII